MNTTIIAVMAVLCSALAQASTDTTATDSIVSKTTERIVVAASRWQERASTSSRQIISLSPKDIRNLNPGTSADLLEASGEVYMQRSQAGGGSPRLRGFAANNVLMVMDGVRINNAIYRTGNLQNLIMIDPQSLDEAEVLLGPGSVQYGSDALGGVMVFNTKTLAYVDQDLTISGSGLIRATTATAQRTVSADLSMQSQSFTSYTAFTASSFGDVISGGTFPTAAPQFGSRQWYVERVNGKDSQLVNSDPLLQRQSSYDQINVLQKFGYRVNDSWTLNAMALYTTTGDIPRYDRLYEQQKGLTTPRFSEWYYGPQRWSMNTLSLKGSGIGRVVEDIIATASYQWYQESRHFRSFGSDILRDQTETISLVNLNVDGRSRLTHEGNERDLYYGLEMSLQDATSVAENINIATSQRTRGITRYPDGGSTYNTYAAYVQTRWSLSPSLILSGGLRTTMVELRSNVTDSSVFALPYRTIETSPSAITGSLGFVWRAFDGASMRMNVASGFRAPNIDDIGKVFDSKAGSLVVPNPNLGPMYVTTAEAGIDVSPLSWLTITGTYYHSWLRDLMQVMPDSYNGADSIVYNGVMSRVTSLQNVGSGWIDGVSIGASAAFQDFTLETQASVATGRDNNGAVLLHIVPAFGQVRLTWRPFEGAQLIGETRWSAAWTRPMIPTAEFTLGVHYTDIGLPSWTVGNIRASYDVSRWLTAQASVENIFDFQYRSAGSGISAPGRNIMLALRCRF